MESKILLGVIVGLLFVISIFYLENQNSIENYSRQTYQPQTKELCESKGAQWKEFNTGCHDECFIVRSKEPVRCTQAFSYGCDCVPEKCWNGNFCELN